MTLIINKKIKFFLVFFCVVLFFNCGADNMVENIQVDYKDGKALSVTFTTKHPSDYTIFLKENDRAPLLGSTNTENNTIIFSPIVPFTSGKTYEIRSQGKVLGIFAIADTLKNKNPELVAVYPSADTVPENLLKMYFVFSEPMQYTKNALDFISVFDETTQEETEIFLELQSELWNKEHTQLTLWLDPGRIKTDLIPNQEKGLPILKGHDYTVSIDSRWASANGNPLNKEYTKQISVVNRDVTRPNPKKWNLILPKQNTKTPLRIDFHEPLDATLAIETIQIEHENGKLVYGSFSLSDEENRLEFYPEEKWKKGGYTIHIDPVLEDLAGNNINRLFDTDLSKEHKNETEAINKLLFSME